MRRALAPVAAAATVLAVSVGSALALSPSSSPAVSRRAARPADFPDQYAPIGDLSGVGLFVNAKRWYEWAWGANLVAFSAAATAAEEARRAEETRQAEEDASRTSGGSSGSSGGSVPSASGTCGAMAPPGFPGYIIDRESGGDPNAVNSSSGAAGCAQIMPEHFSSGGCQGMSYEACWSHLWADGAGASNWAETR